MPSSLAPERARQAMCNKFRRPHAHACHRERAKAPNLETPEQESRPRAHTHVRTEAQAQGTHLNPDLSVAVALMKAAILLIAWAEREHAAGLAPLDVACKAHSSQAPVLRVGPAIAHARRDRYDAHGRCRSIPAGWAVTHTHLQGSSDASSCRCSVKGASRGGGGQARPTLRGL